MLRFLVPSLLAVCIVPAAGCQKGPPEITVLSGTVKLDGRPVTAGTVNIVSSDDVVRTSAKIAPDGTYTIVGAPVGPVTLSVSTEDYRTILPEPGSGAKERANPLYVATPKKYEKFESSGLSTIISKGKAVYNVELASK